MIAHRSELRIHAWGGLGSQLFAVALLKDLEKIHQSRKIVIFLHSGGVTRRVPEVVELFPEISFIFKDDYSASEIDNNRENKNLRVLLAYSLKRLFAFGHILESCDDDSSIERIRFWTRSIRGHYSYRTISKEFLEMLDNRICKVNRNYKMDVDVCSIHYRLGDLLFLKNKDPLFPETILREFERISNIFHFSRVEIFSDSPSHAIELLDPLGVYKMVAQNADTVSVMARASQSQYFLGTSSKVSFWIAAIRSKVFDKQSSIPSQNIREISGLLNKDFRQVNFYGD